MNHTEQLVACPSCHIPNFTQRGLAAHKCKGPRDLALTLALPVSSPSSSKEVPHPDKVNESEPSPAEQLNAAKLALEALRQSLIAQEESFLSATLPDRVKMGLHCLSAYVVFCVKPDQRQGVGGRGKTASRRDGVLSLGFEGWLADQCAWLKKPTAYKYMTALKGLGLDEKATEEEIDEALAQNLRIGPVSLKSLCDAAVETLAAPPAPPLLPEQGEFEFLRETLAAYREQSEIVLAIRDQLQHSPGMLRAACARAYATLSALTGTEWSPSDVPDELASVNPDSISL